ncbi:Cse1-domain-containing protein [Patellaria atrata CBS 101060]|uniref:Cse1-domain-containing protein n=1 Tax=Patellaria atrata CBS 101060 TaxID=1346257 RepID=A0A9P4S6R2_9PEZI|nr:Cse1-domain-containing protein [Patellaria atrata CBS 101060]
MAADLPGIARLLEASLDPRHNKQAEEAISREESKPGFSLTLLNIVASDSFPINTRLSSVLCFKNFIRRNWTDEDGNYKLPENEVVAIKKELIGLMISVPQTLQTQLGEVISLIADSDFYERWETLVDDLVSRLTTDNAIVNNGVLQVAHSIFKRWRPLFRSDQLYTEINHVLSKFSHPLLLLLQNTDNSITQNQNDKVGLEQYYTTLNLIVKLFYDLSCQDLPPVFEENLQAITALLHKYLVYDNPILHTDDEAESSMLEFVKAGIFEGLILYVQKYEDALGPFLGQFITSSWNLLTTIGTETKYDILVSKALQFLTSVAKIAQHAQAFNSPETLGQVVEKVILPNFTLRESDVELFEDEPVEFIRRDLEGSDSETRRRAATDFLRQLMEQFEKLVTDVVGTYVNHYLSDYSKDKSKWASKDTAIYLFTSVAAKGASTAALGVKTLNPYIDLLDFFQKNIVEDLTSNNTHPILTVDAIKFLYNFRSQLSQQHWHAAFPLLINHLGSSTHVVYTYAAIAVERAMFLSSQGQPLIPVADVTALSKDLLQHLFTLITRDSAPEKIQENEYLMKCIMRVLIVVKDGVLPILDMVLNNFINITKVIRHNPSNPRFYYYHFEGIGAVIRFCGPTQSEKLDLSLRDPLAGCLESGVTEFMPYVFQLFGALLEQNPSVTLPEFYNAILGPIILPPLWESKGNVPALTRLLSSMISRGADAIVQKDQLVPILGIFQRLISLRMNESYGFDLIEVIIANFPVKALEEHWVTILQLIMTRLSSKNKTENFQLRFVRFFHFISAREDKGLGCDFFIQVTDRIQHDVFKQVYLSIILPDTQKLTRPTTRKTAVISFTKILTSSEAFVSRYPKGWALTCDALLQLLVNPPVPTASDDVIPDQDVEDVGFGVGFTQLQTCKVQMKDDFPEVSDVRVWVGKELREGDQRTGGRIAGCVRERLSEAQRRNLEVYMSG